MRGLAAYFAILCWALASGAPTNEEKNIFIKNYDFGDKDVLNSADDLKNDELVYALCEGSDADKKCKVYLDIIGHENTVRSCDVNLKYSKPYWKTVALHNTGYNKIVFAVREEGQKIKFINVNMSSCRVKEATINVTEVQPHPPKVVIFPHENNYNVIFSNSKLCQDSLCKATFDYDGNVVKAAFKFVVKEDDIYNPTSLQIKIAKMNQNDESNEMALFQMKQHNRTIVTAKNENKIGVCAYNDKYKLFCKQYDAEAEAKILEAQTTFDDGVDKMSDLLFDILNLEKGLLAMMSIHNQKDHSVKVIVVPFDGQGKQGKVINFHQKLEEGKEYLPKLYKNTIGEPCIASFIVSSDTKFSVSTRCFSKNELF